MCDRPNRLYLRECSLAVQATAVQHVYPRLEPAHPLELRCSLESHHTICFAVTCALSVRLYACDVLETVCYLTYSSGGQVVSPPHTRNRCGTTEQPVRH